MDRRVLNVGGNNKSIPLPPQYERWEHVLLDIDPRAQSPQSPHQVDPSQDLGEDGHQKLGNQTK